MSRTCVGHVAPPSTLPQKMLASSKCNSSCFVCKNPLFHSIRRTNSSLNPMMMFSLCLILHIRLFICLFSSGDFFGGRISVSAGLGNLGRSVLKDLIGGDRFANSGSRRLCDGPVVCNVNFVLLALRRLIKPPRVIGQAMIYRNLLWRRHADFLHCRRSINIDAVQQLLAQGSHLVLGGNPR